MPSRFAVSNIGLPAGDHTAMLPAVAAMGIAGIEVAPSRIWSTTGEGLSPGQVSAYRRHVEAAGLKVVGLHSLFFDHPELGLFKTETRSASLDFLAHLSAVCRDLGGRTLIWGGGRRRGAIEKTDALNEAIRFISELCRRIESHGTCICFEPLGPKDSDFINSGFEALHIAAAVDHPAFAVQLDAKALHENKEDTSAIFLAAKDRLTHFHANQPGLAVLDDGPVDHRKMGNLLREIGYEGYVSIEQRLLNEFDPLSDLRRSAAIAKECYA